jgi:hypothetical protein
MTRHATSAARPPEHDAARVAAAEEALRRLDRLLRGGDEGPAEDAAEAVVARLRAVGGVVALAPGVVRCGGAAGQAGQELDGRWHLASLAGISGLAVVEATTGADLLAFVLALRGTRADAGSVAVLRRMTWGDAFPGLVFQLGPSHAQADIATGATAADRETIDARRAAAVRRIASAAANAEPLARPGTLDGEAARALRIGADAADFWLGVELALLDGDEGLRQRSSSLRHAAWLRRAVADGPTLRLAASIGAIHGSEGAWTSTIARELAPRQVGRVLGRHVPLDDAALAEVETLLRGGDAFAGGLASGLLERGGAGDKAVALRSVLDRLGLERLWELASLDGIDETAAHGLALVLHELDAAPQLWADLVGWSPPRVAAWILRSAPKPLLQRLVVPLRRSLRERGAERAGPLLEAMVASDDAAALGVLGELLLDGRGAGFAGRMVPDVCAGLVRHGLGRRYLVPIVLERAFDVKLRCLALRALYDDDAALEEAARFRVSEMMEPKELQDRLKAARKHLKDGKRG